MQKDYYYELIKYKPKLFSAILNEYNTHLKDSSKSLPTKYEEYFAIEPLLANKKIDAFLLSNSIDFSWNYADERTLFSLLTKDVLQKLALYFGIAINAKEMTRILDKNALSELKENLENAFKDDFANVYENNNESEENLEKSSYTVYDFALVRGQYLLSQACDLFMYIGNDFNMIDKIKLHGQIALEVLSSSWTLEQKKKVPNYFDTENMYKFTEKQEQIIYFALKKILKNEIENTLCLE